MELVIADVPVRTPRLQLRPLAAGDAAALHAYRSLETVTRYVPFAPMTRAEIDAKLAGRWAQRRLAGDGDGVVLGIQRVDTGELIGDLSLFLVSVEHRGGEIGWLLHPSHSGRGYATEAARAALSLAFEDLGLHRIVARVDARNDASLRLCERLGMRREAVLRQNEWFKGEWSDEIDYALLADEFSPPTSGTRSAIESTIRDGR